MADPTPSQSRQWEKFQARIDGRTVPIAKGLILLARFGNDAQNEITRLTGGIPPIVTTDDERIVNEIGRRGQILERLVRGALLRNYGVRFIDGDLDIVSQTEPNGADIYPAEGVNLGIAPIIVVAGIVAFTLLIAGDQAADRLESEAKIEALRLQKRMVDADREMARQPPEVRRQWSKWKDSAANQAAAAMGSIRGEKGWLETFIGSRGTMGLIAGGLALAGLAMVLRNWKG